MSVEKTEKRPNAGNNHVTGSRGRTKAHLIDAVHQRHGGITKAEAGEIVDSIFSTIKNTLVDGRTIRIKNFGTFQVIERPGRRGVNPSTGEHIFIPPHRGLRFRPAQQLKEQVTPAEPSSQGGERVGPTD